MKGRKPTPSKIVDIRGGTRYTHEKPRDKEPQPPSAIPQCPRHLDKEARAEWRRMAKELEPLGVLTKLDKAVFAMYCEAFSTWAQATKKIQEMGMVRITKNGYAEQNPYFPIVNKAKEQMMKCLVEMGMTPSSRSRVKVGEPPQEEENKKERFFK